MSSSTRTPGSVSRKSVSTKDTPGSPKLIKSQQSKKEKDLKSMTGDSSVANAAAKGRQSTKSKKTVTNKGKEKRDRKPMKKRPKQNPILMYLGYGADVVLKDRRAVEVAQSLDLRQFHLRVMKMKFDSVDVDG